MHCNVWCMKQRPLWLLTTKEWMPFHNPFLSGIKDTRNLKLFTAAIDELLSLKNACNDWFPLRKKMKSWKPILPNLGRRWLDWLCCINFLFFFAAFLVWVYSLVEILIILFVSNCWQRIEKILSLVLRKIVNFFCLDKGFISNSFLINVKCISF